MSILAAFAPSQADCIGLYLLGGLRRWTVNSRIYRPGSNVRRNVFLKVYSHLNEVCNTAAGFRDGGQVQLVQVMVMQERHNLPWVRPLPYA